MQAGKLYRHKYDTVADKAIKMELEVKNKDFVPNYELLDSIIDAAKANIELVARTRKKRRRKSCG